ncbi:erythromycin esterase family protein [Saccharopolyspora sp. NPDC047091]|uniref:erythromycin esterase family protein n=1 Tax=Saccharopolyspora sp. NPDC047091 TaxID=3155924 RepID=UPI003406720C
MRFELGSLDPVAPLDDLEPLLEVVGDARVVAVGESNHDVREFGWVRHRVARLLVERAGFDVVAFESGFAEGLAVDEWVRSGGAPVVEVAARGLCYRFGEAAEVRDLLSWVRSFEGGVRFAGVDLPGSSGGADRVWPVLAEFLAVADPGGSAVLERARRAVGSFAAVHSGLAMGRYAALSGAQRDAVGAVVGELLARVAGAVGERDRHAVAYWSARGVWALEQFMRELVAGGARMVSRDAYMAGVVRWLLERWPGSRIVLLVHNGHAQRVVLPVGGGAEVVPAGAQLDSVLGAGYRAVAVTCEAGTTTGLTMDAAAPGGLWLHEAPLPPVEVGSVEAWLAGRGAVGVDVRGLREGPSSIRHAEGFVATPVAAAFDAVVQVPRVRPSDFVLG